VYFSFYVFITMDSPYIYHLTPIDTHWWLPLLFCISTPEDGQEPCPKHVEL